MDERFENPYTNLNNNDTPKENDIAAEQPYADNGGFVADAEMNTEQTAQKPVTDLFDPPMDNMPIERETPDKFAQPAYQGAPDSEVNKAFVNNSEANPTPAPTAAPYSCEWYGSSAVPSQPQAAPPYSAPQQVSVQGLSHSQPKKKREKKGVSRGGFIAGIAICLCLSFVAGLAGTAVHDYIKSFKTEIKNGLTINRVDSDNADSAYKDGGLSTVEIVEKAADSVVEITTETVKTGIFAQQYIESGAGSGVIVDESGTIVTNHHVIDGATNISVTLRDGTSYDATLVGSDAELDIALLTIEADVKLTAAVFGDSDKLRIGERTVAIGNPLGQLGGSVTEGILSALNRDVVIDDQTMSLLQTDTAINPGNSGGGLFDSYGNLIGIVNAKSSGSEVEGLGFAIPINDVINVIGDLSEYGYVRGRVALGMTFIDVDSEQLAWMYGLKETGCYIYSVDSGSNADKAGLNSGDMVVSVNSESVKDSDDVENIIDKCEVGEEVTFTVKTTSNKTKKVTIVLEEYIPESEEENFFENNSPMNDYSLWWSEYNQ